MFYILTKMFIYTYIYYCNRVSIYKPTFILANRNCNSGEANLAAMSQSKYLKLQHKGRQVSNKVEHLCFIYRTLATYNKCIYRVLACQCTFLLQH